MKKFLIFGALGLLTGLGACVPYHCDRYGYCGDGYYGRNGYNQYDDRYGYNDRYNNNNDRYYDGNRGTYNRPYRDPYYGSRDCRYYGDCRGY